MRAFAVAMGYLFLVSFGIWLAVAMQRAACEVECCTPEDHGRT